METIADAIRWLAMIVSISALSIVIALGTIARILAKK